MIKVPVGYEGWLLAEMVEDALVRLVVASVRSCEEVVAVCQYLEVAFLLTVS